MHLRWRSWLIGCRCCYVGSTSGVPQIAADLSRRPTRQPWARTRHRVLALGHHATLEPSA
jgi:hypothetical protein